MVIEESADRLSADSGDVAVRLMRPDDVGVADGIMRRAFGTFLGLPDPGAFMGDASLVRPRALAVAETAWVAETAGAVVGSNFATRWGSVGFFGPLSVTPELSGRGVGSRLLEPVDDAFRAGGVRHAGLFTWAHSPRHLMLYQRHGYWPRFLTAVMARPVRSGAGMPTTLASLPAAERDGAVAGCRHVAEQVQEGLDLSGEIRAVAEYGLGDTVLIEDGAGVGGFAVCHHGAGTEAGSAALFVKFGAVAPGPHARRLFSGLLDACEARARALGAAVVIAGTNTARGEAYRTMLEDGFAIELQGVAMQRGDDPAYNRPGAWVIDDWR